MPSYQEIMSLLGFKSKNAVYKLVNKLVAEKVVSKDSRGRLSPNKLMESSTDSSATEGMPEGRLSIRTAQHHQYRAVSISSAQKQK